jgi:hypothetical protein
LKENKKTEIEYLNEYVCQKAKNLGIKVSFNQRIVKLVKEIEDGIRKPDFSNLVLFSDLLEEKRFLSTSFYNFCILFLILLLFLLIIYFIIKLIF